MKLKQPLSVLFWSSQNSSQYQKLRVWPSFSFSSPAPFPSPLSVHFFSLNFSRPWFSCFSERVLSAALQNFRFYLISVFMFASYVLTLGRTRKVIPATVVQREGGGGWWNPFLVLMICCCISKIFYLYWKAFDLPYKTRYILSVVAMLEACDVTNYGRYLGRH